MGSEKIIIVDEDDVCLGSMDKMLVHRNGTLHRAFSILLYDESGNMLIQRRSSAKYHSPLLWANACCSHQRETETLAQSAHRRLDEELGIRGVHFDEAFVMRYWCDFGNSLSENEIDHVLAGKINNSTVINFNRDEVEEVAWVSTDFLKQAVGKDTAFAYWFRLIIGII
jgi:isopentenyl-diphosphate Delta-isomerase